MDITNAIACPWCGGKDRDMLKIVESGNTFRPRKNVWCPMCNVKGPEGINERSAVEQWNSRAGGRQPEPSATDEPSTSASAISSEAHVWLIQYSNADGISHLHQTIFEHEVRAMAKSALEHEAVSLSILRTQNPVPLNGPDQGRRASDSKQP